MLKEAEHKGQACADRSGAAAASGGAVSWLPTSVRRPGVWEQGLGNENSSVGEYLVAQSFEPSHEVSDTAVGGGSSWWAGRRAGREGTGTKPSVRSRGQTTPEDRGWARPCPVLTS